MLSFFKSSKKKAPKKGQSFYHRENLIQTIEELNSLLDHLDTTLPLKTDTELLFKGFSLDSIIEKNLEDDFGEESFLLEPDSGIDGHKIYFYRISSEHFRFLISLHFINDQFFFAVNKVYSESLLSDKDKKKVIKQITNKYYPDAPDDLIEFNIEDPKGNVLFTHDDIYYYIKYLPNNSINQKIKKQYTGYHKPEAGAELKETLDELI